ncbi:MAG: urea ABC transporter permease subunit UrtB [Gammaproteobacteria bacterium HGW-Gammaproteobacteria-3]|nr:MAG: urea ABC transporter permease subunit UrtB [Gammaproteobacteria bacterium HGW-Gammaproteobacteria-3]
MKLHRLLANIVKLLIFPALALSAAAQAQAVEPGVTVPSFSEALTALKDSPLSQRGRAIERFAQIRHPQTLTVLQALLKGNLFVLKNDGRLVIGETENGGYRLWQADTGDSLAAVESSRLDRINLTNRMRSQLRMSIALLQLKATDPEIRLNAVRDLGKNPDDETLSLLKDQSLRENDAAIQQALQLTFALQDLDSSDRALRLAALEALNRQTSPEALNRLRALTRKDANGGYPEQDAQVLKLAKSALVKIEARLQFYAAAETVFFGLSLGAVLVLAAIGLSITFGVMGVINMAHGELMMLGAYTTYVMQQILPNYLGLALLLSIPLAFIISGLTGIVIERGIIRFLYGRPLETLLATFGVSLFLQQTVRSIFSPLNRSVTAPDWMSGSWQVNEYLSLTWNRLYIFIFCLLVFTLLLQILRRTRLGLEVRAVAQNRNMAKAMGIPVARVDAMTFGLGSGVAGVAGVALSQITNVGPNLGQAYIVDSFMVVVFGGVGNLWGTLVAGFILGIANKVLEPFAGAVLAKILVLVFIILFIQKRPRGLFPQKGRAAEA